MGFAHVGATLQTGGFLDFDPLPKFSVGTGSMQKNLEALPTATANCQLESPAYCHCHCQLSFLNLET